MNVMKTNINVEDGIKIKIKEDQRVFSDCFTEPCKSHYSDSITLRDFYVEKEREFYEGDSVYVKGLMKLSDSKDVVEDEVRVNYNVGDRVSVCSNNNILTELNVVSVEDRPLYITTRSSHFVREFEQMKDGNVKIFKNQMLRIPYSKTERNVFMFEDFEGKTYEQFVDASLPTGSVLIKV